MKRLIISAAMLAGLASSAAAADLPVKARPAPPPVAVYNWTGFYVGGNIGYSWGTSDTTLSIFDVGPPVTGLLATATGSFDMDGVIGGLQAGYNWQSGAFVLGVEADIQASGQKGSIGFLCPGTVCSAGITAIAPAAAPVTVGYNQHLDWFGTLRLRAGWTVTPTVLLYATGGLAFGHFDHEGTITGFTAFGVPTSAGFSGNSWEWGWTIGGGIEAHLGGNWTAKLEYLYVDYDTVSVSGALPTAFIPLSVTLNSDVTDHIVRVGLNYKFGGGPVVARY